MKFIKPEMEMERDVEDASWAYLSRNPFIRYVYYLRLKKSLSLVDVRNKKILDIGTGCGILLPSLAKENKVVGIDDNEKFLEKAKKLNLGVELKKVDIENGLGGKYDVVFALSVLEHVKNLDFVLDEIKKVLDDEGILIVGVPIERIFVKSFFKLVGINKITDEKHVSDYKEVEKKLRERFKIEKIRKIPFDYCLDGLSIYKIFRCKK